MALRGASSSLLFGVPQGVFSLSAGKERDEDPRSSSRIAHAFIYHLGPLSVAVYIRGGLNVAFVQGMLQPCRRAGYVCGGRNGDPEDSGDWKAPFVDPFIPRKEITRTRRLLHLVSSFFSFTRPVYRVSSIVPVPRVLFIFIGRVHAPFRPPFAFPLSLTRFFFRARERNSNETGDQKPHRSVAGNMTRKLRPRETRFYYPRRGFGPPEFIRAAHFSPFPRIYFCLREFRTKERP